MKNGFVKVAAAAPVIRVADAEYNADRVIDCMQKAAAQGVKVLAFPELTLTGASCYDLYQHSVLLDGAKKALARVAKATAGLDMLCFVGLPLAVGSRVYSAAAALYDGEILALIPRENVDGSPFSAPAMETRFVKIGESETAVESCDSLFICEALPALKVCVELGADRDALESPALRQVRAGATLVVQMASFPETVSSRADAELQARYESRHWKAAVLLAAPGRGESSTDCVCSGLCLCAENGKILCAEESADSFAITEIDADLLQNLRRGCSDFEFEADCSEYAWGSEAVETALTRKFFMHPHLPETAEELPAYCERMLDIQVSGLIKRMEYAHLDHCVVGISGGVDSTLCVLVCARAVKQMGLPAANVVACTLPCFGTSSRTKSNAIIVAEQLGCEVRVIDIGKSVYQHFDDIGHAHDDYSIAFENAQARERTQVLMDIANKVNGLDVGTEDLSEYIDGWCTYNGDHTSMYDVNLGLTKTQVRANVRYLADTTEDRVLKAALYDVLECPVTPELLPIHDDQIEQKSEEAVGSYSLQDFFTHCILIEGFTPSKTLRLAKLAYANEFTDEELHRWLASWCKRLFSQQFKRSCLMDGPAVEAFTVSPRVGFRMPSDGEAALFLAELDGEFES